MKYLIDLWLDETVWNGYIPEEGEDPLYDKYFDWMNNGKGGDKVFAKISSYMKEWDENTEFEGGSLYRPNGVDCFAHIEIHPNILDDVSYELDRFCKEMKKDKDFNSCPIELKIGYKIEKD